MTKCDKCGIDPDEIEKLSTNIAWKLAAQDLEFTIKELVEWWRHGEQ